MDMRCVIMQTIHNVSITMAHRRIFMLVLIAATVCVIGVGVGTADELNIYEKIIQYISNTFFVNKTTTAVSFIALISIAVVAYGYVRKRN